jgi:hypothetical protein
MQKINSNQELYQAVRGIAEKLKAHGQMDWHARLQNALRVSTVTGEILGQIKLELSELEEKRIARKLGLLDMIKDALLYLVSIR